MPKQMMITSSWTEWVLTYRVCGILIPYANAATWMIWNPGIFDAWRSEARVYGRRSAACTGCCGGWIVLIHKAASRWWSRRVQHFWYENASIVKMLNSLIIYPKMGSFIKNEGSAEHTANKVGRMFLVASSPLTFWGIGADGPEIVVYQSVVWLVLMPVCPSPVEATTPTYRFRTRTTRSLWLKWCTMPESFRYWSCRTRR